MEQVLGVHAVRLPPHLKSRVRHGAGALGFCVVTPVCGDVLFLGWMTCQKWRLDQEGTWGTKVLNGYAIHGYATVYGQVLPKAVCLVYAGTYVTDSSGRRVDRASACTCCMRVALYALLHWVWPRSALAFSTAFAVRPG